MPRASALGAGNTIWSTLTNSSVSIAGRECLFYEAGSPRYILIQPLGNHEKPGLDNEVELIHSFSGIPFAMAAFQVLDWDMDLSPWHDPAINRDPAVGSASGDTLGFVTDDLIPVIISKFGDLPIILGGYSLGGLFSLWAATVTARFTAIAAASPSLWIRGWEKYSIDHPTKTSVVYLSLGDREEHVRNRSIAKVGDAVRSEYASFFSAPSYWMPVVFGEGRHRAPVTGLSRIPGAGHLQEFLSG